MTLGPKAAAAAAKQKNLRTATVNRRIQEVLERDNLSPFEPLPACVGIMHDLAELTVLADRELTRGSATDLELVERVAQQALVIMGVALGVIDHLDGERPREADLAEAIRISNSPSRRTGRDHLPRIADLAQLVRSVGGVLAILNRDEPDGADLTGTFNEIVVTCTRIANDALAGS